ncbi:SDR family oxidoreductase [Plastoroseomonas hellenica]|uniref:SDR family oxidoreductase n=1 Tax=Plastoroseomonas hellenica TaxID=2687306 RepID=UPI001BA5247C|nr:SDR family oxidoreductase [Plastoroseomonas hellenica]MBR0644189.1 SDR family oxidoreductase [Plastoroseomonas hellenica]
MFRDDLFAGKRVLVTGGGTGLGRMMAERLLSLGAAVEIWGRRGPVVEQTAAELNAIHPGRAAGRVVDIKDPDAVEAAVAAIWAEGRPCTHLINNAAGNFVSRTEDLSSRGFHAIADIVFHGTFQVTQAVGKRWIQDGTGGAVLSVVVTWVRTGAPFVVPSAMSKAGIDAMTKSLAVEWGRHGIRLNAIAPGTIPTEGMFARLRPGEADPAERQAAVNPMGRIGTPQDIGDIAAFLLSPIWINGETIALDGGQWLTGGGDFKDYLAWGDAEWAEAKARITARNQADKAQRSGTP